MIKKNQNKVRGVMFSFFLVIILICSFLIIYRGPVKTGMASSSVSSDNTFSDHFDTSIEGNSNIDQSTAEGILWDGSTNLYPDSDIAKPVDPDSSLGNGLIGVWHLDGDASDATGNLNSVEGGSVNYVTSKPGFGQGFQADTEESYIDLGGDVEELENIGQITVSAWVKRAVSDSDRSPGIVSKTRSGFTQWKLDESRFEKFGFTVVTDSSSAASYSDSSFQDTEWHHVVGRYNGTHVIVYVDGAPTDSTPNELTGNIIDREHIACIGGTRCGIESAYYDGIIDDVAIWGRGLSDSEIRRVYEGGPGGSFSSSSITSSVEFNDIDLSMTGTDKENIAVSITTAKDTCAISDGAGIDWSSSCLPASSFVYNIYFGDYAELDSINLVLGYESICMDGDGDGWGEAPDYSACTNPSEADCDDDNSIINPASSNSYCDCDSGDGYDQGSNEICENSIDEDCDGLDSSCSGCDYGVIDSRCKCGGQVYNAGNGYCCYDVWQSGACPVREEPWSFVMVSDTYGGMQGYLTGAINLALEGNDDIKFFATTGDLEDPSRFESDLQSHLDYFSDDAGYTRFPWFDTPGNHNVDFEGPHYVDYLSETLGPHLATQLPEVENFRWGPYDTTGTYPHALERTTYSFDYRDAHFIFWNQFYGETRTEDNNVMACIYPITYEWIRQDLDQNTKPIIFIFGHEASYPMGGSSSRHCGDSLDDGRCPDNSINWRQYRPVRDEFWRTLYNHSVIAEFAGHEHFYNVKQVSDFEDFDYQQCIDTDWNCVCQVEDDYPHIQNGEVLFPENGVIEYMNPLTATCRQYTIVRIDGDKINFSYYSTSPTCGGGTENAPAILQNSFVYDAASLMGAQCSSAFECPDKECKTKDCVAEQCTYSADADGTSCTDDGIFCNGEEKCSLGVCSKVNVPCADDGVSCTLTCDEISDQCNVANAALCLPSGACTSATCNPTLYPTTGCGNYLPFGCEDLTAETIFVDMVPGEDCTGNYNPSIRDCDVSGSYDSYNTIAKAAAVANVGYVVEIREGTYNGEITPQNSGVEGYPIIFRSYGSEIVTVTGSNPYTIDFEDKSYITFEGLNIDYVSGWARILDSDHIILRSNNFTRISGSQWLGLVFVNSSDNKIVDNIIIGGDDNLHFVYSHRNLIEGNRIEDAGHTLMAIKCGNNNVVRDNYFYNQEQKAMEIFDCNDETTYTVRHTYVDSTKHNLVEDNIFAYTAEDWPGDKSGPFNGIQYAGQEGVIRNNVFYNNGGGGIGLTTYGDEAEYNTHNRIYNNVFYGNNFGGMSISSSWSSYTFEDNIIKNNIFYKNNFENWGGVYDSFGWSNADKMPFQIFTERNGASDGVIIQNNNIVGENLGDNHVLGHADDYENSIHSGHSLADYQSAYSSVYLDNIELGPGFVNAENNDFQLTSESDMIDAGAYLTTVIGGSGTTLIVEDSSYFYDGFSIEGETGDLIQLEGQSETARIVDIDYSTNTMSLDKSLTLTNGLGVSLAYAGDGPDIGAFEFAYIEPPVECIGCQENSVDQPSTGNNGGSGGGSTMGIGSGSAYTPNCVESWKCDEWSICDDQKTRKRICIDENGCRTNVERPEESRQCTEQEFLMDKANSELYADSKNNKGSNKDILYYLGMGEENEQNEFWFLFHALWLLVLIPIAFTIIYLHKKRMYQKIESKEEKMLKEDKQVGSIIDELKKEGYKEKDIKKEFMVIKLKKYISEEIKKGIAKSEIKKILLKAGWSSNIVNESFKEAKKMKKKVK